MHRMAQHTTTPLLDDVPDSIGFDPDASTRENARRGEARTLLRTARHHGTAIARTPRERDAAWLLNDLGLCHLHGQRGTITIAPTHQPPPPASQPLSTRDRILDAVQQADNQTTEQIAHRADTTRNTARSILEHLHHQGHITVTIGPRHRHEWKATR